MFAIRFSWRYISEYENKVVSKKISLQLRRIVESYVFRRAVCDIPTNSLSKTFRDICQRSEKETLRGSVKAQFCCFPSYRRFPDDEEFVRQIKIRNLYKWNRRSYWLRRFENHGRKEHVPVQNYTIEHIMPQNENLSAEWREALRETIGIGFNRSSCIRWAT